MHRTILRTFGLIAALFFAPASAIEFVDAARAVSVAFPDPSAPCVARLPAWELSVGEGTYSRFTAKRADADCRAVFGASVRNFTDEEKAVLTQYVAQIDSIVGDELPRLVSMPWRFILISDSSGFGVPDVSGYIILTTGLLKDMQEWMANQTSMRFIGMETLIHEKAWLLQRNSEKIFEWFYSEAWGFHKIPVLSTDKTMRSSGVFFARSPLNQWAIKLSPKDKEYIMPALFLRDAGGKEGGGTVQRVAVVIDSTSKGFVPRKGKKLSIEYRDLRLIPHYRKKFPLAEYDYNPAELSADLLAKYIVMKYVSSRYGTHPTKASEYSQIDVLIKMLESGNKD